MTDNEIIEYLKEILETMLYEGDLQNSSIIGKTLDLINRQKAEIERLQKHNTEMARKHYQDGRTEAIKEAFSRIESECVDTFGNFNYRAYLNLKCDMRKEDKK